MDYKLIAEKSKASQDKKELETLLKLLPKRDRKVVVEIGVHQGYSLLNWSKAFDPMVLVGIDNDVTGMDRKTVDKVGADIIVADSHSKEARIQLENILLDDMIDFLFIDGDHTFKGVRADFEDYSQYVRSGGDIVLHDVAITDNPTVEVYKYWTELKINYDHVTIDHGGTGFGLIFNYGQ